MMEAQQMDLKYLFSIILLWAVILFGIKFIEKFLKTKKSNDKKRKQINESIDEALQLNNDRLEQIIKDYDDLYLDFIKYKKSSGYIFKFSHSKTSNAAPLTFPDFTASYNARLSINSPLDELIMYTPLFIDWNSLSDNI